MANSTTDSTAPVKYVLYQYKPSFIGSAIFIGLFFLTTHAHMWQLFKKRTWYFIPFVIGGIFEEVGYAARLVNAKQKDGEWTTTPYIIQSLLLLLAPTLFAASIYMILGRIINLTDGEEHSLIRRTWLTKIFVTGDVISFMVQAGGGGMLAQAKTEKVVKRGELIITGGLVLQLIYFSFFIIVAAIFHMRIARNPTRRSLQLTVKWKQYLFVLYMASAIILVRSAYRVVEYIQGNTGVLQSSELYLFIFDGAMMFSMMLLLNIRHPGSIINKETLGHQYELRDMESQGSTSYPLTSPVTQEGFTGKR